MSNNRGAWTRKRMFEIGDFYNGLSGKVKEDFLDGNAKFITYMNVYKNMFAKNDMVESVLIRENESQTIVRYGDILFSQSSETLEEVGLTSVWLNSAEVYLNSFCFGFRIADKKILDSKYAGYLFRSYQIRKRIVKEGQGNIRVNLSSSRLRNLELCLPSLPEQKKIAEILSTWDEAIETNTKLLYLIEKYRASQLSNYFLKAESSSAKKSLEELEDSGSIKLGRGRVISRDEMKSSKGLFPVYSSSIKNNGLMGYIDEYLFDEEMITWSIDGGGNFFYRDSHKFSVTNVSGFLKIMDADIKPYFLANQLKYLHSRLVFDYQTKAHPSVIRSLYKVQIPSLNEQIRFEYLFKSFDTQIEKINQYINELQKQKQGLMQRLLTGKVRVKID